MGLGHFCGRAPRAHKNVPVLTAVTTAILFELLESPPPNAQSYRFDSVAVKEPKFEIDGIFLPPQTEPPGIVYFCEVQFQKDAELYERLFGELFLYFYRNRDRFSDWQAVMIYPSRSVEQINSHPYRALLESAQVHRVFLDELGEIEQLSLGLALMVLTTLSETVAPQAARDLLAKTERESLPSQTRQDIIDMIGTIMVYKFTDLSPQEVDRMLGIKIEETRVYREAQEEKARAIALNLIQQNIPLETIAQATGLTMAQLRQLQVDQPHQP